MVAEAELNIKNLQEDLSSFRKALETYRQRAEKATSPSEFRFRGVSIVEAAEVVLREAGHPMKAAEITQALLNGGLRTTTKTPYIMIFSALSGSARFVKKGRGVFDLIQNDHTREWSYDE